MSRLNPQRRKHADGDREVLLECVANRDLTNLLVVEDPTVARRLGGTSWTRWCHGDTVGTPWPAHESGAQFSAATLRLQRSKAALDMAIHATAASLPAGATCWLYGTNDEGIRSAKKRMAPLFEVQADVAKKHSRVYEAVRTEAPATGPLSAWRTQSQPPHPDLANPWTSYPGAFAKGRLDEGTAILLKAIPTMPEGAKVLDFACGLGVIAGVLAVEQPNAVYHLSDADVVSLQATAENVSVGTVFASDGWANIPTAPGFGGYDCIVSNPPFHRGRDEDFTVAKGLINEAHNRLTRKGQMWLVCQRQVPLGFLFNDSPLRAEAVATTSRFTVWRGTHK